jgi:hypothetical protein
MFGRWLKLPRDGPDLLRALLPIVRSTSVGITGTGRVPQCTPGAAPVQSRARAARRGDPLLDRQLAIGLLFPSFSKDPCQ